MVPIVRLCLMLWCIAGLPASPANEQPSAPATAAAGVSPVSPEVEALRLLAERVRALTRGELDARVDPDDLFTLDLSGDVGAHVQAMVDALKRARNEADESPPPKEPLQAARRTLAEAWLEFLALPSDRRQALLAAHAEKRAGLEDDDSSLQARREELERLRQRAERLEAFVAGKLDPSVNPASLLTLDLRALGDFAQAKDRLERMAGGSPPDAPTVGTGESGPETT